MPAENLEEKQLTFRRTASVLVGLDRIELSTNGLRTKAID